MNLLIKSKEFSALNTETAGSSETSLPCPKVHGVIFLTITAGVIKNLTLELHKPR